MNIVAGCITARINDLFYGGAEARLRADQVTGDFPKRRDPRRFAFTAHLLLSPEAARDPDLKAALQPLVNAIPDHLMRSANRDVDVDGNSVEMAAVRLRDRIASSRQ